MKSLKLQEKILFLLLIFLHVTTCFAPPDKPDEFKLIQEKFRVIPKNSIVEGSSEYGGIQPDYEIDSDAAEMKRILSYARALKSKSMTQWQRIDKISKYIKRYVLPKRDYDQPEYVELVKEHTAKGKVVPLSSYIKCKAGVCREYSMLTHLMLNEAGIPSFHAYAKIRRASNTDEYDIVEDHGFVVVRIRGKDWVVDPYYWGFHGFNLNDLMSENGITEHSKTAPVATPGPGFRKIIELHTFPRIWVKKEGNECKNALTSVALP